MVLDVLLDGVESGVLAVDDDFLLLVLVLLFKNLVNSEVNQFKLKLVEVNLSVVLDAEHGLVVEEVLNAARGSERAAELGEV